MKQPIVLINGEKKKVASVNFGENHPMNFEIEEEGKDGWPVHFQYDKDDNVFRNENGESVNVDLAVDGETLAKLNKIAKNMGI